MVVKKQMNDDFQNVNEWEQCSVVEALNQKIELMDDLLDFVDGTLKDYERAEIKKFKEGLL